MESNLYENFWKHDIYFKGNETHCTYLPLTQGYY